MVNYTAPLEISFFQAVSTTTPSSVVEQLPLADLAEVEATTSVSGLASPEIENSTATTVAAIIAELSTQVSELLFSGGDPDQPPEDPNHDQRGEDVDVDGQRRQLLIGVICLAIVLVLVLSGIFFFFYKV